MNNNIKESSCTPSYAFMVCTKENLPLFGNIKLGEEIMIIIFF